MTPSASVAADSSPLIALARLNLLRLLPRLFTSVLVPQTVLAECTISEAYPEAVPLRAAIVNGWLALADDPVTPHSWNLDPGETSVIGIAIERQTGVIMDDQAGRRMAHHLGIPMIGTAGILVQAKRKKIIKAVRPQLERLSDSGYYLDQRLLQTTLHLAGEV